MKSAPEFINSDSSKIVTESVEIPGSEGMLEGEFSYNPKNRTTKAVLLLPPHPHFAGNMNNNVIKEMARYLSEAGYAALRFNYPGIGKSTLSLPEGLSVFDYWDDVEQNQRLELGVRPAVSALNYLKKALGKGLQKVTLIGYSFGAIVALNMSPFILCQHTMVAIAMPWITRYNYGFVRLATCPKIFLTGRSDFTYHQDVFDLVWPQLPEPKQFHWFDSDHFFRKREIQLAKEILNLISKT